MKRKLFLILTLISALLLPQSVLAWNATGHQLVARIAWEHMTPTTRQNVIMLLQKAPPDACLLDLLSSDTRPLEDRQREFFMLVATWPDIVRPKEEDTRPCIRFHQRDWHFINFFWEGFSGGTGSEAPEDSDIPVPELNAVDRLKLFRPLVACGTPQCGTPLDERAMKLAWILHLVGDIHQPLHTSARVTPMGNEKEGDQGGNLFKLGVGSKALSLHSFWDGIINRSVKQKTGEKDLAYHDRVAQDIMNLHSRATMSSRLLPIDFEAWSQEGLETTKRVVYPKSLRRGVIPDPDYQKKAFEIAQEAIALGGYRLAELLNQMFGS